MKFYEDKRKLEIKVGIFTLLGVILLILSYLWFTDFMKVRDQITLKVKFNNIGNLEKGAPVNVFGVKRGYVDKLIIIENGVVSELKVNIEFPLKSGTEFRIVESDLMGNPEVEIKPGNGNENLDLSKIQIGANFTSIADLINDVGDIFNEIKGLNKLEKEEGNIVREFRKLIENSNRLMINLNESYDESHGKFEKIMTNLEFISSHLSDLLQKMDIEQTYQLTNQAIRKLKETSLEIGQTNQQFKKISQELLENDSSFKKIISEKKLYDNLLKTTSNLDSLILDIKQHPKKYFEIKVF